MQYWIIALPKERLKECLEVETFGLNRRFVLPRMKVGDKIALYGTKIKQIVGFAEITGPYYMDDTRLFAGDLIFPDRINLRGELLPRGQEIDFTQVVDRMSFIKNVAFWNAHFNGSVVQISKSDWDVLQSQIKEKVQKTRSANE